MPLPLHDVTTLTEAFRRAVLRLFVRRELMDVETAQGMLAWAHSGFHVHDGVWVAAEDRALSASLATTPTKHRFTPPSSRASSGRIEQVFGIQGAIEEQLFEVASTVPHTDDPHF